MNILDKFTGKVLDINSLPDNVFLPVIQERDIYKARILTRQEKQKLEPGSPDVQIKSLLGYTKLITRNQLMKEYVYLGGGRISLYGWKSGQEYLVMRINKIQAYAMLIPTTFAVNVNGRVIKSTDRAKYYIVCLPSGDGRVDKRIASIINSKLFKKMFSIPANEVINKYKGNAGKGKVGVIGNKMGSKGIEAIIKNDSGKAGMDSGIKVTKVVNIDNTSKINNQQIVNKDNNSNYQYTAIGIMINSEDKIVGFVVKDRGGKVIQVSKRDMLVLCEKKLVSNIVLAIKEDGKAYLRGNGIKIEELPPYYV